mmetsp:Transcript_1166/g.2116  ORF Transcript_1166/g.2116 Transcript_1166/m.2116 type:complete len:454 (+) Transcript_1166:358-1719(+)
MARRIADAGKGDQDNENPVDFTGEEKAFAENIPRNNIHTGIDCHQDDANGQHERLDLGNYFIDGSQKSGQAGLVDAGIVFKIRGILGHGVCSRECRSRPVGSPRRGGVSTASRRHWPAGMVPSGSVVLNFFQVFLELVQQFLTALASHFDELLFHLRRAGLEGFDLFVGQAGNGDLIAGLLDLGQGLVGKTIDVHDDFFKGEVGGVLHQLLVFVRQAFVEILVGHHGGGEPAVLGKDEVRRHFVQTAGLDPENGVFLTLDHIGLQSAVHFTPRQRGRCSAKGRVGLGQKRVGHDPDLLVVEVLWLGDLLVHGHNHFPFRVHLQELEAFFRVELGEVLVNGFTFPEELDNRVHVGRHQVGDKEDLGFGNQGTGKAGRLVNEVEDARLGLFHDVVGLTQLAEAIDLQGVVGIFLDVFLELVCEYILDVAFVFLVCIAPVSGVYRVRHGHRSERER